jgi:hypothetical protein
MLVLIIAAVVVVIIIGRNSFIGTLRFARNWWIA